MDKKEEFSSIEVMRRLFEKDYENKVCVECKCPMPSYVSINNAILLCDRCAQQHMQLGYNVSYVRHITAEWDPYLYAYLERGGNSRFIRLSNKYELDKMPIVQKYNTRILEYYRLLIKSEVLADAPPFEIPYEVAKEPINNGVIYFPEFANYQIYEGKLKVEQKKNAYVDAFRFVGNGLGSLGTYLTNKYQEHDMNNKIITGGKATLQGLAGAGKFLFNASKPVVKYVGIRAVQGIGYLCGVILGKVNDANEEEEEEEEEKEKINTKKGSGKKKKKKKKPDNEKTNEDTNINNNQNNYGLKEGDYIFQSCIDYPTFESINKADETFNNNNNININDNFNINNFNQNNNYPNQINGNYQNNNIIKPDYVIPSGLDSSSHENSIVGEK